MEREPKTVLSVFSPKTNQLGIQYINSEFYKMNNQFDVHNYEEIESALQQQCDFVDSLMNNLSEVNKELKQISCQSQDEWAIEKSNLINQISTLKAQKEKIQIESEQEIKNQEIKFQLSKQNLIEEHNKELQIRDNTISNLQAEIKNINKQKEDIQTQMTNSQRKQSNDQISLMQKLHFEKELNKMKDENKILKCQVQQLQDQNAKFEEQTIRQYSSFQEQLLLKQQELTQVKSLAQVIIDQRTQIEDFFIEALQRVEQGEDLQIKNISQQAKVSILRDIIGTLGKQNKKKVG